MHNNPQNVHNASASSEKSRTTLFIENEVRKHAHDNKVNLSEFVNREYRSKYLSINAKEERLAEFQRKQRELAEEIERDKERAETTKRQLTHAELRYLSTVIPRRREGKEMAAMWRFFNREFERTYTFAEFEALVRLYEGQAERRAAYAISRKRRQK